MASTVDELTVTFVRDGVQTVREEAKEVLTKGTWATVMFMYRDLDRRKGGYGPLKFSIRRYNKRGGTYRQDSRINISSLKQAKAIHAQLTKWIEEAEDAPTFIPTENEGGE